MIRILYLITDLDIGGAEKNLYYLVSGINKKIFEPRIMSLKDKGEIRKKLLREGIYVYPYSIKRKSDFLLFSFNLFRIIRDFRPHILHTFLFHANFIGRIIGKFSKVPCIISSVRVMEMEKKWHIFFEKWTKHLIDKELCVCDAVKNFRKDKIGISENKLEVIYNGLEGEKISNVKPLSHKELGVSEDKFIIGTVSRLEKQKGIEYLLDAVKILIRKNYEISLVVVGMGKEENNLKEKVDREGIKEHVSFLGFRRDVLSIIASFDLFVLSSLWEGFPNALLEAQSLGIPCVVTDVGGSREIVKDGETGIIVPSEDSFAIANAIMKLINDNELREKMGKEAKKAKDIFTVEKMVSKTEALYKELIEEKCVKI